MSVEVKLLTLNSTDGCELFAYVEKAERRNALRFAAVKLDGRVRSHNGKICDQLLF